jgi:outer membrane biosynthesis protein TonB
MSTTAPSEFIMGHSADDAADRRAELRKIGWALLAALVIHLLIGSFIAVFHDALFTRVEPVEEDKPMEMTIVDLPPTPAATPQKNSMFMETDESKAKEAPKEKTFESNANSIAASQQSSNDGLPLPSQEGRDRPTVDLESHAYSLPNEGAQPQPSVAPKATPEQSAIPQETPREDQLAMLTKPTPQPSAAQTPAPVRSTYRPMKQQTKIAGAISNRGIASINAIGTPLGRYQKIMSDAIGSRWYADVERRGESANVGDVVVSFFVDRSGQVKNVRIIQNTSNETFANICLQSILEAHLPPIPDEVAAALPSEGLEVEALRFSLIPR